MKKAALGIVAKGLVKELQLVASPWVGLVQVEVLPQFFLGLLVGLPPELIVVAQEPPGVSSWA